ncbi:hypothetical protein DSOL_2064 [Desulfosporosinus metallidurans]|uniref:Uncharacterized protein n=1 Tax=Desulfosporosinus metallidurans TaxID=1888891 RepID=A0A1Q8QXA9_9FIRM|nr:hypothetical protein DSOL_2064 [Desulfosporosinus metallidurans]
MVQKIVHIAQFFFDFRLKVQKMLQRQREQQSRIINQRKQLILIFGLK